MNFLDIAILVILGAFILKGVLRGLLKEVCSLAGLVGGGLLALRFHAPLAESLMQMSGLPGQVCVVVAFLALFLCTVLFFAVFGYLLSRFIKLVLLGGLNRVTGGFFGLIQGVLLLSIVLFALSQVTIPEMVRPTFKASRLAPPFEDLGQSIFKAGQQIFSGRL